MMMEYDLSSSSCASMTSSSTSKSTSDIPMALAASKTPFASSTLPTRASGRPLSHVASSIASTTTMTTVAGTRRSVSLCTVEELRKRNQVLTLYYSIAASEKAEADAAAAAAAAAASGSAAAPVEAPPASVSGAIMEVDTVQLDQHNHQQNDQHVPVISKTSRRVGGESALRTKTSPTDNKSYASMPHPRLPSQRKPPLERSVSNREATNYCADNSNSNNNNNNNNNNNSNSNSNNNNNNNNNNKNNNGKNSCGKANISTGTRISARVK